MPDVVISNAGISIGMDTAVRENLKVMARPFSTNTIHPRSFHISAVRVTGALVRIGSVAGIRGLLGCASKAAVIIYWESLRGELRASCTKAVMICSAYIDTPLSRQNRYSMLLPMKAEVFSEKAFSTIESGRSYRVIPWQMGMLTKLLRLLPNALFDRDL